MLKRIAMAAVLVAGLAGDASASTVTYIVSGIVEYSSDPLAIGSRITATFVIETATPGTLVGVNTTAYYGAVISASGSVGSQIFTGPGTSNRYVAIQDNVLGIGDGLEINFDFVLGSAVNVQMHGNGDNTIIGSQALQLPTDPNQFPFTIVQVVFGGGVGYEGRVDSIQLVPEPSLAALLGAGALGLALRRRSAA